VSQHANFEPDSPTPALNQQFAKKISRAASSDSQQATTHTGYRVADQAIERGRCWFNKNTVM
jgi:hypothetical protein